MDKEKNNNEAHYYDEAFLSAAKHHPELLGDMIQRVEAGIHSVIVQYEIINIRELPSLKAPILDVAKRGDVFSYVGNYGAWVLVELDNGNRAYMISKGVSLTKEKIKTVVYKEIGKCRICWKRVNLRDLPDRNSKIVGFGEKGDSFNLHRDLGAWVAIDLSNDVRAYVVKEAVELEL